MFEVFGKTLAIVILLMGIIAFASGEMMTVMQIFTIR